MSQLSKHQSFEMERWPRGRIQNAEYNPRVLDPAARKKLSKSLKKSGLVQPVIVNRRNSKLVGGHQRLSIMDDLEGTQEYSLDVAVIDVSDKEERELNIFLNNPAAQGQFDLERLQEVIQWPDLDLDAIGFDATDLQLIMPELEITESGVYTEPDPAQPAIDTIKDIKKRRKDYAQQELARDGADFYISLVAADADFLQRFMAAAKIPLNDRFVDLRKFCDNIGFEVPGP
jgi:hypothetical protein